LAERMKDCHQRLEEHHDALHLQAHQEALSSSAFWGANLVVWYTINRQLTLSSHIDQVRKKVVQRLGVLGSPEQQLIHLMMDCACPILTFAVCSHIRKLQVLQSKCLHSDIGAPW
jgi:hypothetical protein